MFPCVNLIWQQVFAMKRCTSQRRRSGNWDQQRSASGKWTSNLCWNWSLPACHSLHAIPCMPGPGKTLRQLAKNVGHGVGSLNPNRAGKSRHVGIKGIASPRHLHCILALTYKLTQWPFFIRLALGDLWYSILSACKDTTPVIAELNSKKIDTQDLSVNFQDFKFQERRSAFWSKYLLPSL